LLFFPDKCRLTADAASRRSEGKPCCVSDRGRKTLEEDEDIESEFDRDRGAEAEANVGGMDFTELMPDEWLDNPGAFTSGGGIR